jgi:hypothetical protein
MHRKRARAFVTADMHFHLIVISKSTVDVRVAQLKSKQCGVIRLGLVVLPRAAYGAVQRAHEWWWRGEHACGDANDLHEYQGHAIVKGTHVQSLAEARAPVMLGGGAHAIE